MTCRIILLVLTVLAADNACAEDWLRIENVTSERCDIWLKAASKDEWTTIRVGPKQVTRVRLVSDDPYDFVCRHFSKHPAQYRSKKAYLKAAAQGEYYARLPIDKTFYDYKKKTWEGAHGVDNCEWEFMQGLRGELHVRVPQDCPAPASHHPTTDDPNQPIVRP